MSSERPYALTDLEVSIIELLLDGFDDGEMALQLNLAYDDLGNSLQAIMLKMDTRSRTEVAIEGLKAGILKDDNNWARRNFS